VSHQKKKQKLKKLGSDLPAEVVDQWGHWCRDVARTTRKLALIDALRIYQCLTPSARKSIQNNDIRSVVQDSALESEMVDQLFSGGLASNSLAPPPPR